MTITYLPATSNYKLPQGGNPGDYLVKKGGASYDLEANSFSSDVQALIDAAFASVTGDVTFSGYVSAISLGVIVNADINASAAIALSKLAALTTNRALVSDVSGVISVSSVTNTELGHVSGVTSAIQTQIDGKQPLDATLTALAAHNTNGFIAQTAADTFAGRTHESSSPEIVITNGNGVSGNPSYAFAAYPYTLIDYGGANFNGTSTRYTGNALTGIADSKVATIFTNKRFANNASSTERFIDSTGSAFFMSRNSAGNFQVQAENAAGTSILNVTTNTAVAALAGRYRIEVSIDMAVGITIKVNGVIQTYTTTTSTNDTIDWTVAQYVIGTNIGLTQYFAGDFNTLYFNPTVALDITDEAVSRKFYDVNGVPNFLGQNGEFVTGTPPALFLAYDKSDAWHRNKGLHNSTAFTPNGTIADAATALYGRDGGRIQRTITPTGTTGAQTINKRAGSVNFAAGAGSLVVTNNLVSTFSIITLSIATVDATMTSVVYTPANGSFTITPILAPTAETRVDFIVEN